MKDMKEDLENNGSFGLSKTEEAFFDYKFARHLETKKVHIYRELSQDELSDNNLEKYKELGGENILSFQKEGNLIFFEYCNGGTLEQFNNYISFQEQLDEIQIQKIVKKILNGLESLHKARKIYNAPSLNNIFINFENKAPTELGNNLSIFRKYYDELIEDNEDINYEIKIKYFISTSERKKFIEPEENSDHQKIQYYLAPEILKNNDDDTNPVAADMWSVGMITYKLLLGGNKLDMLESPKNGYISFPNNLCPSFEIIHFITSLLKMDPKERPTFETIKNHDFLKRKPEEFDFLNLELISQTQNNGEPIKLLLNKKFSIYKYLINTTMDNKIDKLMRFEIEKDFLLDKKITFEKNIQNLKNQIEECRNLKNAHKEKEKLNNLLTKCVNDFKLNEERLNNIQNNLNKKKLEQNDKRKNDLTN